MANSRTSGNTVNGRFERASVDTDPGASGYGTNSVCVQKTRGMGAEEMWFSIKTIGTGATITLQYSSDDTTYYDYADYTEIGRYVIHDSAAGTYWKPIVKDDAQGSSGTSLFELSW